MGKKVVDKSKPKFDVGETIKLNLHHPLYAGQNASITQYTGSGNYIVELESGDRVVVPDWYLSPISISKEYLSTEEIAIDGGTQSRACLNDAIVEEYAESMDGGVEFPPVLVFYDGSRYWLADGFHRLAAAKKLEWGGLQAEIRQGTRREAVLYSVGANDTHGLRRSNADKRRAVMLLLGDAEWSSWSDREIARCCKVSNNFVSSLRRSLSSDDSEKDRRLATEHPAFQKAGLSARRTYISKHGTETIMNTANIGRSSAALGDITQDKVLRGPEHSLLPSESLGHQASLETSIPPTQLPLVQHAVQGLTGTVSQPAPQDLVREPKSKHKQLLPDIKRNPDVPPGEPEPTPASVVNESALAHGKTEIVNNEWTIGFLSNMDCLTQDQLEAIVSRGLASLESDRYYQAVKNLDSIACRAMVKANKQVLNERHHPEYFKGA